MTGKISQWRTVTAVLILGLMVLVSMMIAGRMPDTMGEKAFESSCWTFVFMSGLLCGKSLGQYAATGGGVSGVVKAVFTNAKPDSIPPPAPTP